MKQQHDFSRLFLLMGLFTMLPALGADDTQKPVTAIEVNAAKEFVAEHDNVVILDVRTPIEYDMSHIPGSANVDVQDESFEEMLSQLDRDKTYIVQCTKNPVGGRSSRALESMQKLGFRNLYSLEGGYVAWKDADLPLTETSN